MTNATTSTTEIHPFERAGLGKAPFRCIGTAERVHAVPGCPPRAGGHCHFCFTGIRYAAIIKSSDGKVFDVGMDCVRKTDAVVYKEAREARRAELRAARQALSSVESAARRAGAEAELAERRKVNEAAFRARKPEIAGYMDALVNAEGYAGNEASRALSNVQACSEVDSDPTFRVEREGKLRELFYESTAAGHVGAVGKRETLRARYLGYVSFETQFGVQRIYKLAVAREDGTHAMLTWKTSSVLTDAEGERFERNSELTIKATIKAHGAFRGQAQTEVTRPKFFRLA
jgi:hypothetical protein